MSKINSKQAGFTLVEITLAMAIFTFMLLVVSMAYINIARLYSASTAARNVQQNNRFAMEQITRVARTSNSAVITRNNVLGFDTRICLLPGNDVFYLKAKAGSTSDYELHQAKLAGGSTCNSFTYSYTGDKTLTSDNSYVSRMVAATSSAKVLTLEVWMTGAKKFLASGGTSPKCKQGAGSEYCSINKLTTSVELRGE